MLELSRHDKRGEGVGFVAIAFCLAALASDAFDYLGYFVDVCRLWVSLAAQESVDDQAM